MCSKCNDNYSLITNVLGVLLCRENEQCKYKVNGVSVTCNDGYTVSNNGTCISNVQCKTINNRGHCTDCNDNYASQEGSELCESFPGCNSTDDSLHYLTCVDHKTIDFSLTKCMINPYCSKVEPSKGYCTACDDGYTLRTNDHFCVQDIRCAEHVESKCSKCITDY